MMGSTNLIYISNLGLRLNWSGFSPENHNELKLVVSFVGMHQVHAQILAAQLTT